MTEKKKEGRPTKYTEELGKRICEIVSSHPHGIQKLCKMFDELPVPSSINLWRQMHPEFSANYATARIQQAHLLFENGLDELEDLENYVYENQVTGAKEINPGIVAMKKAIANHKSRQAAIINKNYRLNGEGDDTDKFETLNKIKEMVDDLNKTNTSEI